MTKQKTYQKKEWMGRLHALSEISHLRLGIIRLKHMACRGGSVALWKVGGSPGMPRAFEPAEMRNFFESLQFSKFSVKLYFLKYLASSV